MHNKYVKGIMLVCLLIIIYNIYTITSNLNINNNNKNKVISYDNKIDTVGGYTLIVSESGDVYEWDLNYENTIPQKISGLANITSVCIKGRKSIYHSAYAIDNNGYLYTWKFADNNQKLSEPERMDEFGHIKKVIIYQSFLVALLKSNCILLIDSEDDKLIFQIDIDNVIDIETNYNTIFALKQDRTLWSIQLSQDGFIINQKISNVKYFYVDPSYLIVVDYNGYSHVLPYYDIETFEEGGIFDNIKMISNIFLLTNDGILRYMEENRNIVIYDKKPVIHIFEYTFITQDGDVFYLKMGSYNQFEPVFIMNIFEPPVNDSICEEFQEILFEETLLDNLDYSICKSTFTGFANISSYCEGLFVASKIIYGKEKWGYIDINGNEVIPFIYDYACSFNEGLATVKVNKTWGYINKDGKLKIVLPDYEYCHSFSEGYAAVLDKNGYWGYIDINGELIIECKYDYAYLFSEGLAAVRINGRIGFIDYNANLQIPMIFDQATWDDFDEDNYSFRNGVAKMLKDNCYGYIDKAGNIIIPFIYDYLGDFSDGLAKYRKTQLYTYGYLDITGKEVIHSFFDKASDFNNNVALVSYYGSYYLINKNGESTRLNIDYDIINELYIQDGLIKIIKDSKVGFADIQGNEVIPCSYDYIFSNFIESMIILPFSEGYDIYSIICNKDDDKEVKNYNIKKENINFNDEEKTYFIKEPDNKDNSAIVINNAYELCDFITENPNGNYVLSNDIDLSTYNNGLWIPLEEFNGVLDGQGYSIKNLYIPKDSFVEFAGLFIRVKDCIVKNLGLEIIDVYGSKYAGGIAAFGSGTVENCYIIGGTISARRDAAGIFAILTQDRLNINQIYIDISIESFPYDYGSAGGVVASSIAYGSEMSFSDIYFYGSITSIHDHICDYGRVCAGGIIGDSEGSYTIHINNVYINADIEAIAKYNRTEINPSGFISYYGPDAYSGGIIGYDNHEYGSSLTLYDNEIKVDECVVQGDILAISKNTACSGGLFGYIKGINNEKYVIEIMNSSYTGFVHAQGFCGSFAGGLKGKGYSTMYLDKIKINAQIFADGGIHMAYAGNIASEYYEYIVTDSIEDNTQVKAESGQGEVKINDIKQ